MSEQRHSMHPTGYVDTTGPHGHEHGQGGVGKYLMVFLALCGLTAISFVVGNNETIMSNRLVGWSLMMAVSCAKALLVILFFMHLIWEANWKYVLTIPASIMSIFLILMLVPDIGMRTRRYSDERLLHAATPELPQIDVGELPHEDEAKEEQPPAAKKH